MAEADRVPYRFQGPTPSPQENSPKPRLSTKPKFSASNSPALGRQQRLRLHPRQRPAALPSYSGQVHAVEQRAWLSGPITCCDRKKKGNYTAHNVDVLVAHVIPLDLWYVVPPPPQARESGGATDSRWLSLGETGSLPGESRTVLARL